MQEPIVTQDKAVVATSPQQDASIERIAYRPKGRLHPEQWVATVDGQQREVTSGSARLVLDLARDMRTAGDEYRTVYQLQRWPAADGGRSWWVYKFTDCNELAAHLVEVAQ
ncbi:MAG: hypothetical protein KC441_20715 [Anaerolineales bacterium]|nr:hypothetical protein [Anaerolineales bacterium]